MRNRPSARKYKKPIVPESMVVNQCIRYLHAINIFCWRNNTGAYCPDGSTRFIRYGYPGSADVFAILAPAGTFLAIECKTERGKQSDKQKAFQERVEQAGGVYLLIHSLEELIEAMRPLLVPF